MLAEALVLGMAIENVTLNLDPSALFLFAVTSWRYQYSEDSLAGGICRGRRG